MLDHLIEFFARTHLIVLHFPIALLIVAAMVELFRALNLKRTASRYTPGPAGTTMFGFAFVGCAYTVLSGLVFGFSDGEKVDLHRILGVISAVLVLLAAFALLKAHRPAPGSAARIYLTLLSLSALTVALTAHFGGELTHGKGFITRPLTQIGTSPAQSVSPLMLDPVYTNLTQAQLDTYLSNIQPIFNASCIECHGADKAENDVRLDALEYVLDPDLDILVHGDADASEIMYLIELPAGDPDLMPPEDEGKPLNAEQIDAIRAWINSLGN